MRAWRLARRRYAALDGAGASRYGGRWNRRGQAVVYASEHLSLTVLEIIVHLDLAPDEFPDDYVKIAIEIPDSVSIQRISVLPPNDEEMLRTGVAWYESGAAAVLMAPSVVVPEEYNLLFNPAHADFSAIKPSSPERFRFDRRLVSR